MPPVTLLMADVCAEPAGEVSTVNKNAQLVFMVLAATSTACVRMEGHVTESVGTAHVRAAGLELLVNWNVLRDTLELTVKASVNVRMVARVTVGMAGARVWQAGLDPAVRGHAR